MTTIQAIDLLKGLEQSLDDYCELNDEGKTAFRMAIAALELFGNAEQLPSAQPETCEGCKHLGKWENEVEYGYPSPCTRCKRKVEDHYER